MFPALLLTTILATPTPPQAPSNTAAAPPTPPQRTISIEDEVLSNVKAQPVGPVTVAELAYPDEYLRRVSDRIVRSSFESRYRVVVPDPKPQSPVPPPATAPKSEPAEPPGSKPSMRGLVITGIVAVVLGALYLLSRRGARGGAA